MKHRNSHFAVGYWSRLRRGRTVPDQADIDPKALKRLLPFLFLLEARADGSFIYRLAGTTLCDRYARELRSKNFLSHWDAASRERLGVLLRQALVSATPVCLTSIGATSDCRMVELETVLMPVTFGGETPERFLAISQVLSDASQLNGRAIAFERLIASSLVREDENETDSDLPPPPEPPAADRRWRAHPKAPHLKLVVSHDRPSTPQPDPLRFDTNETLRKLLALYGTGAAQRTR